MAKSSPPLDVTIERDGKQYSATYTIHNGAVTVRSVYGTKTAQLGGSAPARIARLLLGQLVIAELLRRKQSQQ